MRENEEEKEVREKKKREVDKSRKEEEAAAALIRKAAVVTFCDQRSAKLFLRLFLAEPKHGTRLKLVLAERRKSQTLEGGKEKKKKKQQSGCCLITADNRRWCPTPRGRAHKWNHDGSDSEGRRFRFQAFFSE